MKKCKWLLPAVLCLCLLWGCKSSDGDIFGPASLTAAEQEILALADGGDVFIWDYRAPSDAEYLTCTLEYYQGGERQDAAVYSAAITDRSGRISVAVHTAYNPAHGTSMGQTDFFDHVTRSQWNLRLTNGKSTGATSFYTGFDLLEPHDANDPGVTQWECLSQRMPVLEEEIVLVCYGLEEGKAGTGLDAGDVENPQRLSQYGYAYVLKCKFTAQRPPRGTFFQM